MMQRFSSNTVLIVIVIVAFLMLFGLLGNTMLVNERQYNDYQLTLIKRSPYACKARITDKYSVQGMATGFNLEYQFKGKAYSKAVKVPKDMYDAYDVGDNITITLAQSRPSMAVVGEVN